MTTSTALMTAEDLIRLPRGKFRYELVNGELKVMSPSGEPHGRITARLTARLVDFVYERGLGEVYGAETGFKLTTKPDTVLAPDIAFIDKERLETVGVVKGFWPGAPDLVVEVLSPANTAREVREKIFEWFSFGSKQVWTADPEHGTIKLYRSPSNAIVFSGSDCLEAHDLLPGFRISLAKIFGPTPGTEKDMASRQEK